MISDGYTKNRKGVAGRRLTPCLDDWSNRRVGSQRRLLLFAVVNLDDQVHNADEHKAELKRLWICQHWHPPPFLGGGKKSPSGMEGPTAYRYRQRWKQSFPASRLSQHPTKCNKNPQQEQGIWTSKLSVKKLWTVTYSLWSMRIKIHFVIRFYTTKSENWCWGFNWFVS